MSKVTQRAVIVSKTARTIKSIPIPSPDKHEVLIKNVAVASNPKDWKLPYYMGYEAVEGNDVAGYVEKVGEGVTKFKVGDKVAAFTVMKGGNRTGAYQQYSIAPSHTTFHLGPQSSFEDASTLPLAYMTAVIGLFARLGLPTPDEAKASGEKEGVLIYGAAATVGYYATQLAKMSNLYVVAIAGSSAPLLEPLGVDELIDYRGKSHSELVEAIKKAYNGKLHYAYDVISENGTLETIAEAFKDRPNSKITYTLTYDEKILKGLPDNIATPKTLVGAAHGGDSEKLAEEYFDNVGKWLEDGSFKPMKATIIPGGLDGVEEGLRRLKEGEVRGEKLVFKIDDTKDLVK